MNNYSESNCNVRMRISKLYQLLKTEFDPYLTNNELGTPPGQWLPIVATADQAKRECFIYLPWK